HCGDLTASVRGRALTSAKRRGGTMSSGARGAEPPTPHGPLERLLGVGTPTQPRPVRRAKRSYSRSFFIRNLPIRKAPRTRSTPNGTRIIATPREVSRTKWPAIAAQTTPAPTRSTPFTKSEVIARRLLTVKLRGRTTTSDERRGRTLSPGARGAKPQAHHGPLQRLLEVMADVSPTPLARTPALLHPRSKRAHRS